MTYVPVSKDLSKVEIKVASNLTKWQVICFATVFPLGSPLLLLLESNTSTGPASMAMTAVMLPCFFFTMYEKHGQPLEAVAKNVIQTEFVALKE